MECLSISHEFILMKLSIAQRLPPLTFKSASQQHIFTSGDKHNSGLVLGIWLAEDTSQPEREHRGSVVRRFLVNNKRCI